MAFIDPQNARALERVMVVTCTLCGEDGLAWTESPRTGRRYLADVALYKEPDPEQGILPAYNQERQLIGYVQVLRWRPHFCPVIEARRAQEQAEALSEDITQTALGNPALVQDTSDYEDDDLTVYDGPEASEVNEPGSDELLGFKELPKERTRRKK